MSKTERIAQLEQQIEDLTERLNEQLDVINLLCQDVRNLQRFKRLIQLEKGFQYDMFAAMRGMT